MKAVAAIAGLAGLLAFTSLAQAEQVRFRGGLTLTRVQNCKYLFAGETFSSTFRPAKVGDNPNVTSLSHFHEFGGDIYELAGKTFKLDQWMPVKANGIANEHYAYDAKIQITSQSPAVVTKQSKFVTLTGAIQGASDDPGTTKPCVAAFRASYFRRYEY